MKKKNLLSMGLAALLLFQSVTMGVAATEEVPSETVAETVAVTTPTETTPETIPEPTEPTIPREEIPFGEAGVDYGCRTIEGKIPLGGSAKVLSTAQSVFVYEKNSDTVLYGYQPDQKLAPGGLVQIVTALLAVENCNLNDIVTVSTRYINELPLGIRHQNLRNGEEVTVRDLLYCLLLASANDAAMVLAQQMGGTPSNFITMMNQRVAELGCTNTNITTVSGLDDPEQYSTARDLARILGAAMENEDFREIIGTSVYYMEATNKSEAREIKSMNHLLDGTTVTKYRDSRVSGGKASYTSAQAGASIAFTAANEELDLVCVILGATRKLGSDGNTITRYGNFEEAGALMDHCFGGFHVRRILYQGQSMIQIPVEQGANDVVAMNQSSVDVVLPTGIGLEDLTLEYNVKGGTLQAPLVAEQEVATLRLWHGNACVGETMLYAMSGVALADRPGYAVQNGASRTDGDLGQVVMLMVMILMAIGLLVVLYLLVMAVRRSMARRKAQKLRRQKRKAAMEKRRGSRK